MRHRPRPAATDLQSREAHVSGRARSPSSQLRDGHFRVSSSAVARRHHRLRTLPGHRCDQSCRAGGLDFDRRKRKLFSQLCYALTQTFTFLQVFSMASTSRRMLLHALKRHPKPARHPSHFCWGRRASSSGSETMAGSARLQIVRTPAQTLNFAWTRIRGQRSTNQ